LDWAFSPTGVAEVGVALVVVAMPLWVHLSLMEECRGRIEQGTFRCRREPRHTSQYAIVRSAGRRTFPDEGLVPPRWVASLYKSLEIAEQP